MDADTSWRDDPSMNLWNLDLDEHTCIDMSLSSFEKVFIIIFALISTTDNDHPLS